MRLALYGFGNVGRALARTLLATNASFTVTAVVTRQGASVNPGGIDLAAKFAAIDRVRAAMATMDPRTQGNFDTGMPWDATPLGRLPADVLVEMTPLDPVAGEPALTYIREALTIGMHVVTANKGPIARAYRELDALAT